MQLRDRSRKFIGPSPTNASSDGIGGKSAQVTTALTPGNLSAFSALIDMIRAWAWGLRLILPHSMPGIVMSAPKLARPVTLSTPSGRIGRVPTTFWNSLAINVMTTSLRLGNSRRRRRPHLGGGVEYGAHDLVVAGAAAQIAGQPIARLFLGRVQVFVEQGLGRDDEARGAEAALQGCVLEEFLLHRMQLVAFGDALDCDDV